MESILMDQPTLLSGRTVLFSVAKLIQSRTIDKGLRIYIYGNSNTNEKQGSL